MGYKCPNCGSIATRQVRGYAGMAAMGLLAPKRITKCANCGQRFHWTDSEKTYAPRPQGARAGGGPWIGVPGADIDWAVLLFWVVLFLLAGTLVWLAGGAH